MVIDNEQPMRELFEFFLTDEGWEVFSYGYAQANLEVVQQLRPDLIILDLNMFQAGAGWEFLQLLKMEVATAAIPVVICTTALSLSVEIDGYLATRQISIVRKPFDVDAFVVTIRKHFTPDLLLPILVVEDNGDLAEVVTTVLRLSGYRLVTVSNGQRALDALAKAEYSLILLEMALPIMNGLKVLEAYAQQPGSHTPVIIFSGQLDSVTEGLPPFVIADLPKPFALGHLVALVGKYAQPTLSELGPR
jgi:CheY-like chemotaxis protein